MASKDPLEQIEEAARDSGKYDTRGLLFVVRSLEHCRRRLNRTGHVTGQELVESVRLLAIDDFGPTAKLVLNGWGIDSTEDVGNIVFLLVRHEILSKTEEDTIEDFRNGFDFETEFVTNYRW